METAHFTETINSAKENYLDLIERLYGVYSLQYAQRYFDAGMQPIPLKSLSKESYHQDWQSLRFARDELATHFSSTTNIGILMGDAYGGFVDICLVSKNANNYAHQFLPVTNFEFGKRLARHTHRHRIYRVPTSGDPMVFRASSKILEVRSNGEQICSRFHAKKG